MKKILFIIMFAVISVGCSSMPYVMPPTAQIPPGMTGKFHRVEKGQTLWRISKVYNIDLEELVQINRIADATAIEIGQQIFIPNRNIAPVQSLKYSDDEDFIWPVRGRLVGTFGRVINNMPNKGINIQPYSSLDVLASRGGKVVFLNNDFAGFGKTIIIDHGDNLFTVYARNSQVFVKPGDTVNKGMVIAKVGSSGREKSVYLHFEVRKGYISQNPLFYLP